LICDQPHGAEPGGGGDGAGLGAEDGEFGKIEDFEIDEG
jgi:hypothetical protein